MPLYLTGVMFIFSMHISNEPDADSAKPSRKERSCATICHYNVKGVIFDCMWEDHVL